MTDPRVPAAGTRPSDDGKAASEAAAAGPTMTPLTLLVASGSGVSQSDAAKPAGEAPVTIAAFWQQVPR